MIDLLFKAQKYMNGEDALVANGIDGNQKMEEINELQYKNKEKDGSPNWKNDNESTQAHTRSSSIPKEELITSNRSTTNSHLVYGM